MKTNGLVIVSLSLLAACTAPPQEGGEDGESGIHLGSDTDGETEGDAESDSESSSGDESGGSDEGNSFPDDGPGESTGDLPPPNCGSEEVVVTAVPPNVMLVLDKSGSMTDSDNDWDHDGDASTPDVSRWTSLYDVVDDLLVQHDGAMNFGAVLFPSIDAQSDGSSAGACMMADEAEVAVAANNGANILAAIPGRLDSTEGGTPARFGVLNAVDHLIGLETEGSLAIVLVTDGEANCATGVEPFHSEYDRDLELAVASAYTDNAISTYVVGIDIDDRNLSGDDDRTLRQAMNDIARVGGVPREGDESFYDAIDHDALQAALDDIAQRVECTIELTQLPADPDYVEVTIDGQPFDRVDTCADGDGWRFTSDEAPYDTIELCGSACEAFVAVGAMETVFECPPQG